MDSGETLWQHTSRGLVKTFTPEFLKWTLPSLNLDTFIVANNRMANSVDPDEMAHYEPSHLDLHCLQRYLYMGL